MKRACLTNGILTPKYVFVYDLNKDMEKLDELSFPMIVKHYNSVGSWDMTKQSKVTNK
jgi:D-alanine-D-alanine ligase-like ATP-grasp enzyme